MLDEYTDEFGTNLESKIPEFGGQQGYPQGGYQPPPVQSYAPPPQPVYITPPQPPPQPPQNPQPQSVFIYQQPPPPPPPQPVIQPVYQPSVPMQPAPPPPSPRINSVFGEESKELTDLLKREQNSGCFKNLVFILICFAVVIGSFWLSYLVGARFLMPGSNTSLSVSGGVNRIRRFTGNLISSQDIVKNETAFNNYTRPPVQQTVVPPEVRYTPAAPPPAPVREQPHTPAPPPAPRPPAETSGTMYRVIVGSYDTRQEAQDVLANIRADGFPVYMYQADGKYRLQIGAFRSRALATALQNRATEYGYNAFISIR